MARPKQLIISPPAAAHVFENLVAKKSAHTRRAYRGDLAAFAEWRGAESGPHALADLLSSGRIAATAIVEKWQRRMSSGMARSTTKRRISMLRSFVTAANRVDLVDWPLNPERYSNIPVKIRKTAKRRNMSGPPSEELARVRELLRADGTLNGKRDLAIITLAENPALRRSEIAALDVGDVNIDGGEITIVGKGRLEPEEMPLVPEVIDDIRPWLEARAGGRSAPLFVRIRSGALTEHRLSDHAIWEVALKRGRAANLKRRLRPHGLRHAGITAIAEVIASDGIPISEGMKLSRHRKAETFQAYVDKVEGRGRQILAKAARRVRSAGKS